MFYILLEWETIHRRSRRVKRKRGRITLISLTLCLVLMSLNFDNKVTYLKWSQPFCHNIKIKNYKIYIYYIYINNMNIL